MAGRTIHYADLNAGELAALDPARTIVFVALSPLEVHGPHLPIGCDVIIAEELQRRLLLRLAERYPDYDRLVLPPVYAGADTIPVPGSVKIDSRAIYHLLVSTGRSLAEQGFRYLLLTDNHGGPRHQIAVEKAVRKMYKERLESVNVDMEDLRTKIAASLFNEEPFDPILKVEDKWIRLHNFALTDGKLTAQFTPAKPKSSR